MTDVTFGLYYDFRCTDPEPAALTRRWAGIIDQIAWAEQLGFASVWISEHHFVDDGYASSPLTLAAALAARTDRMTLGTNVVVLPVHHPLRLAEEALTVDALSGGRLRLGVGMGYGEADLRPFGTSLAERRARFEAALEILRHAFEVDPLFRTGPVSPGNLTRAFRTLLGAQLLVGMPAPTQIVLSHRAGRGRAAVMGCPLPALP